MKRDALDALENQLRHEARLIREQDGFSPLLHQRVMAALRARGLAAAAGRAEGPRSRWRFVAPLAAAAALALGAWLILRPGPATNPTPAPVATVIPTVPAVPLAVNPTANALEERKYAYLDRDAQKLWLFVADQLPEFPSEPAPK